MKSRAPIRCLLVLFASGIATSGAAVEGKQLTRRQMHDLGIAAEGRQDWGNAYLYQLVACLSEDLTPAEAVRITACARALEVSGRTGKDPEAQAAFLSSCEQGSDMACFFTAQLEARRGNLQAAVGRMAGLCKRGFHWPAVKGYEACAHLERLQRDLKSAGPGQAAEEKDSTFQELYDRARSNEKRGNLTAAFAYRARACLTDAPAPLQVMRITSCSEAVTMSGPLDGYQSAKAFFVPRCDEGSDLACYFAAESAAGRGELREAVQRMEALCKRGFQWPADDSYNACRRLERLTLDLRATDRRRVTLADFNQARDVLLVTLLAVVPLFLKRRLLQRFALIWVVIVALPLCLMGAARGSPLLGVVALPLLLFYFGPPALVFREPHFEFGIGAGPADATGVILTAAFYTLAAVAIVLLAAAREGRQAVKDAPPAATPPGRRI